METLSILLEETILHVVYGMSIHNQFMFLLFTDIIHT